MPGLCIHRLSDPFALPTQLAAALDREASGLDPLAVVQVVLPAAAWRGWLARRLADRRGIVAGVEFLDLAGLRRQLPAHAAGSTLARVLSIHQALPQAATADPTLADWLARDPDGTWRMSLALRLARILSEDRLQRPMSGVEGEAAPRWWRALQAALPAEPASVPLDGASAPAALHWVATEPLLAHDWALCAGLSRALPVTVWLLEPAPTRLPAPLRRLLGAEPSAWPAPLAEAEQPLPLDLPPAGAGAGSTGALPAGFLSVGAAGSLLEQLRLAADWLQQRFADDPGLSPAEVLLLSPAWPSAVPLIDAVFGGVDGPAWPYRIGGRRSRAPGVALLRALLDSPSRRGTASELLPMLCDPALIAGLDLDAEAAPRWQRRVAEGPGGWGLDAQSRRDWQAGSDPAHSWQVLWPLLADSLDGADPLRRALPRLLDALIEYRDATRGAIALSAQLTAFARLLAALLPAPRRHPAADAVWQCWQGLRGEAEAAGSGGDPAWTQAAFARLMAARLAEHAVAAATPTPDPAAPEAGLRFAPLQAGAIRPARLIVLFGLDALSFPRRPSAGLLEDWRATLDRLHPALAPPSPAAVDRQLLLESLWMAADATLWIHADRDALSGQALPAPTPVEAALTLLPTAVRLAAAPRPRAPAPVARDLAARPRVEPPAEVDLGELCSCFRDPARFQVQRVRQVCLPPTPLPSEAPLSLDAPAAWALRGELLRTLDQQAARGLPCALPEYPGPAQAARLPPGAAGHAAWRQLCEQSLALWQHHQNLVLERGPKDAIPVDLRLDDPPIRLGGVLSVHAGQLFERVAGAPQARHLVHAWVRALALAAMELDGHDLVLVGLSDAGPSHAVVRLPAPETAQQHLAELLTGYLEAWARPLAFTPALGLALLEGSEREAHWRWVGSGREPGESQQPLNRWVWGTGDPTAAERLPELRRYSELLLPVALRRAWRKVWV